MSILLCPFAPHLAEEMWEVLKMDDKFCCQQEWPAYDESKCKEDTVEIAEQINGKVRGRLVVPANVTSEEAIALVKADEKLKDFLDGAVIIKELYVPGKLVNIVVKKA